MFEQLIKDYDIPFNTDTTSGIDPPYADEETYIVRSEDSITIFMCRGGAVVLRKDGTWDYDEAPFHG
jgi:hypothetical protein